MTKQEGTNSEWRDGFLFLGNHLALDLLNTRPVMEGGITELIPDFRSLIRWFEAAELLSGRDAKRLAGEWEGTPSAKQGLGRVVEFRERLRKEVAGWESGRRVSRSLVAELNSLMADYPMLYRMAEDGERTGLEIWLRPGSPESLLGPLAFYASKLFAEEDRRRVRRCGACVLHFLDTSKKGTRHWCSMKLCGNRNKAAAYAARHRQPVE